MYDYFNYTFKYTTPMLKKRIKNKSFSPVMTKSMARFENLKLIDILSMERWMIYMDVK